MMRAAALFAIAAVLASPASAEIYSRTDANGLVVFSNVPPPAGPAARPLHTAAQAASRSATPVVARAAFPRVSEQEQRARDTDRQAILRQELDAENSALRKALEQRLDASVLSRHRANIEAINRELSGLR